MRCGKISLPILTSLCLRQQSGRQASTPHKQSWHLHITCFFWTHEQNYYDDTKHTSNAVPGLDGKYINALSMHKSTAKNKDTAGNASSGKRLLVDLGGVKPRAWILSEDIHTADPASNTASAPPILEGCIDLLLNCFCVWLACANWFSLSVFHHGFLINLPQHQRSADFSYPWSRIRWWLS